MIPANMFPATWSRERRSAVTVATAIILMLLFLWLMAIPLSWLPAPIGPAAKQFAEGSRMTVDLTVRAGVAGILLGVLAALGKLSKIWPLRMLAATYIWVFRGTPLLVQVMFAFSITLPNGDTFTEFQAAIVALALNVGAYNAEAIRAGILAVPRGQHEAARSLGLSAFQTFIDVIFPQAFRISLPALVNNIVSLLKDSSLAYVIGVVELSNIGNQVKSASFEPVPVFITVAAIYLVLTTLMTQVSDAIERQLDVERHK